MRGHIDKAVKVFVKAPIYLYRYTISPFLGPACRHVPSCSEYASDAIERFGAWKGFWLALSRILRCNPWGSHGHDPVPETWPDRGWRFWRLGRWTGRHITLTFESDSGHKHPT